MTRMGLRDLVLSMWVSGVRVGLVHPVVHLELRPARLDGIFHP
jgi:hypothetical protein